MLVFQGTEGALDENPDIAKLIVVPRRARFTERFAELRNLWRRYDLSLAAVATDRALLYCWAAGRRRVGLVRPGLQNHMKTVLLDRHVALDDLDTHTVSMGLNLADALGIESAYRVVPPGAKEQDLDALLTRLAPLAGRPFALLHPYPKFAYKMWSGVAWVSLAQWLHDQGFGVIFSGGNEAEELAYVESLARQLPRAPLTLNLAGTLTLGETAELIRRATIFVGPDTAVTHIAAATGTPTVALFGPSNPVKWGPWPYSWTHSKSPWERRGDQRQGNVALLQGPGDCVPCLLEGCQRHIRSSSDCLQHLSAESVIKAADTLLAEARKVV